MSFVNYGGLKTGVQTWLNRPDLTSYIPDFIINAESRIFYGGEAPFQSPPLRIPAMQTVATGTISSSTISFPTRFLEPIRIKATSGGVGWSLVYMAPERFSEATNSTSAPTVYTYLNNSIQTAGTGAADYTIDYYQAFASFVADADTNWLLTNAQNIYLYAALLEAAPFLGDDPKLSLWSSMFNSSINALNRATKYQGGGSLATRVVR
jgi:hypothetical protein